LKWFPLKATPFGPRYEVEGDLETPDGRRSRIRTDWQHEEGQVAPQAHFLKKAL
jgi:hypothetical protein